MATSGLGGLRLDVAAQGVDDDAIPGPEVHLRLSRLACSRLADILGKAAKSPPGSLAPGSAEAAAFTEELNALLVREGNAMFWGCALDDSVGVPVRRSRLAEAIEISSGAWSFGGAMILALLLLRGAVALWRDVARFLTSG